MDEQMNALKTNHQLEIQIEELITEFDVIPDERKEQLVELSDFIAKIKLVHHSVAITIIRTHNSRRSQIGQLWVMAAAQYYGFADIHSHSGGMEATTFNSKAVAAMQRAGFKIKQVLKEDNPIYEATIGKGHPSIKMFSKKYDHLVNPSRNFIAIMVCSEADAACPFVPGAMLRVSLPFDDPKIADGTAHEKIAYDEAVRIIGREVLYTFHLAKKKWVAELLE